jgi:hypothetical protein
MRVPDPGELRFRVAMVLFAIVIAPCLFWWWH